LSEKQSRYEAAGVSIDAQDQAIAAIRKQVESTKTPRVLSDLGSFGGLFDIRFPEMERPVLVASADGVGTKLKVAFAANRHGSVGQCLVNHCIDDILVQGAKPLFFMDYIATGKLSPETVREVITGICEACRRSGTALLGGEMAEMPGFYQLGEYDVAGFIVGVADQANLIGPQHVTSGQVLIGLPSSGLHTNGYSLARKIIFEEQQLGVDDLLPGTDRSVADHLLAIHINYEPILGPLLADRKLKALAHITGGGFLDNIPRILPQGCAARIRTNDIEIPAIIEFLLEHGELDAHEAYRVFNMGIGMIAVVDREERAAVMAQLAPHHPVLMGEVIEGNRKVIIDP